MIKALHVFGSLNIGGAETMVMNIFRNYEGSDMVFDFAVLCGDEVGEYEQEVKDRGREVYHITKRSTSLIRHHRELIDLVRRNKYDVVHFHSANSVFSALHVFAMKRTGAKCVIHSHSTSDWRVKHPFLQKLAWPYLQKHTDLMLSCSTEAARWLFGTADNVGLLPIPVDCAKFLFSNERQAELKKKYGFEGKSIYAHTGRLTGLKNHRLILDVFEKLAAEKDDAVLFFMGDGELKGELQQAIKEKKLEGKVIMWGSIPDVYEKLLMADFFIFPSEYEGFPTAVLEAQAAGLRCCISDTITREVAVTDLVEYISIAKEGRTERWYERIKDAEPLPEELRISANRKVAEKYDIHSVVGELQSFYEGILK